MNRLLLILMLSRDCVKIFYDTCWKPCSLISSIYASLQSICLCQNLDIKVERVQKWFAKLSICQQLTGQQFKTHPCSRCRNMSIDPFLPSTWFIPYSCVRLKFQSEAQISIRNPNFDLNPKFRSETQISIRNQIEISFRNRNFDQKPNFWCFIFSATCT